MADQPKKTRRQKILDWVDAHPDHARALGLITFLVSATTVIVVSDQKTQRKRADVIKDYNAKTEKQNKARAELLASENAKGHATHVLHDGRILSIPASTHQETHWV